MQHVAHENSNQPVLLQCDIEAQVSIKSWFGSSAKRRLGHLCTQIGISVRSDTSIYHAESELQHKRSDVAPLRWRAKVLGKGNYDHDEKSRTA